MSKKAQTGKKGGTFSRLAFLIAQDKTGWTIVTLFLAVSAVFYALGPKYLGNVTNVIVDGTTSGGINWNNFWYWVFICLGIYLIQFLTRWAAGFITAKVTARIASNLRSQIEEKLWKLPLNYYDLNQRGDIMSRVTNDIDNIQTVFNTTGSDFIYYTFMIIGLVVMMLTMSWVLALVTVLQVPVSMFIISKFSSLAQPEFKKQFDHLGVLNSKIEESFNGHNVIRTYNLKDQFIHDFVEENRKLYSNSIHATVLSNAIQPIARVITNFNYIIVALFGAMNVINGTMTLGDVQAFIQYSRQFVTPFTQIAQIYGNFQSGLASLDRIYELLEQENEIPEKEGAVDDYRLKGKVDFQDVFFSYVPEKKLIENMNLTVEPGETVAIVGGTGAGKTTMVNLIERFYNINSGNIRFDDKLDLQDITRKALRSNIGMVLQDTWLFEGTIEDNIKYGLREGQQISDEEFLKATKATFVDDFVRKLPDGYQTIVTNEDSIISNGQKQLITIARAFVMNPNILILDEATSSVDTRTEALIQEAINRLRDGRTSFVIAHRLSTIRGADIIVVMENGHIVEQGNHDELIAKNGAYASLYNAQFAG